jgi:hypothetical protein
MKGINSTELIGTLKPKTFIPTIILSHSANAISWPNIRAVLILLGQKCMDGY